MVTQIQQSKQCHGFSVVLQVLLILHCAWCLFTHVAASILTLQTQIYPTCYPWVFPGLLYYAGSIILYGKKILLPENVAPSMPILRTEIYLTCHPTCKLGLFDDVELHNWGLIVWVENICFLCSLSLPPTQFNVSLMLLFVGLSAWEPQLFHREIVWCCSQWKLHNKCKILDLLLDWNIKFMPLIVCRSLSIIVTGIHWPYQKSTQ